MKEKIKNISPEESIRESNSYKESSEKRREQSELLFGKLKGRARMLAKAMAFVAALSPLLGETKQKGELQEVSHSSAAMHPKEEKTDANNREEVRDAAFYADYIEKNPNDPSVFLIPEELEGEVFAKAIEKGGDTMVRQLHLFYPNLFLENFPDLSRLPHAEEFLKEEMQSVFDNSFDPGALLSHAGHFVHLPWGPEWLQKIKDKAMQNDLPLSFIIYYRNYADMPHAKEIFEEAVSKYRKQPYHVGQLLRHYHVWKDQVDAKAFIQEISVILPESVIFHLDTIAQEPFVPSLLASVGTASPRETVLLFPRYHTIQGAEGIFRNTLAAIEKEDPQYILGAAAGLLLLPDGDAIFHKIGERMLKDQPRSIFDMYNSFSFMKEAETLLKQAAPLVLPANPTFAVYSDGGSALKKFSWGKPFFETAIRQLDAQIAIRQVNAYQGEPYAAEVWANAARKDPRSAMIYIDDVDPEKIAIRDTVLVDIITILKDTHPDTLIRQFSSYQHLPNAQAIFDEACKRAPSEAVRIRSSSAFDSSKDPVVETLRTIKNTHKPRYEPGDAAALLELIVHDRVSLEALQPVLENRQQFFEALLRIRARDNHLGSHSVKEFLKETALTAVREINNLHDAHDAVRFRSVDTLPSDVLYAYIALADEEIFTSTFNGLFTRMTARMKQEGRTGADLLKAVGHRDMRILMRMAVEFGRFSEFLNLFDAEARRDVLRRVVEGLAGEQDKPAQMAAMAEVFGLVQDDAAHKIFEEVTRSEYEKAANKEDKTLYGLLAGILGQHPGADVWFQDMARNYPLAVSTHIPASELFDREGTQVQQYFFYDDSDGQSSFAHFIQQYKNKKDWRIENKDTYIRVVSSGKERHIEIFANYPKSEVEGPEAIAKVLAEKKREPIVVVHRGHSYHVAGTVREMRPSAKIISLGSCGGYRVLADINEHAPHAHIVATKGEGKKAINDPLFFMINEMMLRQGDIEWRSLWQDAERVLGKDKAFEQYVPPYKNIGMQFLKSYQVLHGS